MRMTHVLGLVPFLGMLGGVPFVNKIEPYVLGMPFVLFWIVMWVVLTSGIMYVINKIDNVKEGGNS